ncbi:MAG: hypothetical protein ACYC6Z_01255 [Thermoleophilia bacterium]
MNDLKRKALWAGIEDYSGLWEFLWEINHEFPDMPESERLDKAKAVISQLLKRRWINIYQYNEPDGNIFLIAENEYPDVINNVDNWQAPSKYRGQSIRFGTTEEGRKVYHDTFRKK